MHKNAVRAAAGVIKLIKYLCVMCVCVLRFAGLNARHNRLRGTRIGCVDYTVN